VGKRRGRIIEKCDTAFVSAMMGRGRTRIDSGTGRESCFDKRGFDGRLFAGTARKEPAKNGPGGVMPANAERTESSIDEAGFESDSLDNVAATFTGDYTVPGLPDGSSGTLGDRGLENDQLRSQAGFGRKSPESGGESDNKLRSGD
jgi:hypothetical protein